MKKIILVVSFLLLVIGNGWADTNIFPTDGNVGIGTTTPNCGKLSIYAGSGVDAIGLSGWPVLKWSDSSTLHFGGYSSTSLWKTIKRNIMGSGHSNILNYQEKG